MGWDSPGACGGVLDGEGKGRWERAVGVFDADEGALEWGTRGSARSDPGVYEASDEDRGGGRVLRGGALDGVG